MEFHVEVLKVFKISIFILLFGLLPVISGDKCTALLNGLASSQQDYVRCSTENAVPVTLCKGCQYPYEIMTASYDEIKNDQNCSQKFFNHDRINVVQTTQNMLTGLWSKAHCDDCFHNNNSDTFSIKLEILESCLNRHKRHECNLCVTEYEDLNNFYIFLDQHNNGQVCYDLQDAMNQTRVHWSKDLKCCKREFRMTLFVVTSVCVGVLPLIFYISALMLTKRRERNHAVLNIIENVENDGQETSRTRLHPSTISTNSTTIPNLLR